MRAAVAYSGKSDTEISQAIGKEGPDTLRHWKRGGFPRANRAILIAALAEACGVPPAFFTADFDYLGDLPSVDDRARQAADDFTRSAEGEDPRRAELPDRRRGDERRQGGRRTHG